MDEDFFEQGEYTQAAQSNQQQQQNDQNVWQEAEPQQGSNAQMETTHTLGSQNAYNSNTGINFGSASNIEVDDEVTRKIREQQERIQEVLRQKANKEYQQKQARKTAGRAQLLQFLQNKQKQLQERKQSNIEHQKQIIEKARELNQSAGWGKVFENVNLKLGQYKGSKPVNRMRESIINKSEDQKNSQ